MPAAALGLVLGAAIFHSAWNLLVKQARNKQVFLMWAALVSVLSFPALFFLPPVPAQIWPYIIASAIAEALYYIALVWAYDIGDFSLVYPIARGAAPILLTIWSILFLKEVPGPFGLIGILLLVIGLMVVGSSALWRRAEGTTFSLAGIGMALLTATCISIYSTIDGAASATHTVSPLTYAIWIFGLSGLMAAPVIIWHYGKTLAISELKLNWPRVLIVGIMMTATYGAVLFAYSMGTVSYVGSIREVSIVFGAIMGWRFLGEGFGLPRLIGSALIFAGILVIAVLG
jgi:drug/metabolite transporter (DMT)-like permease